MPPTTQNASRHFLLVGCCSKMWRKKDNMKRQRERGKREKEKAIGLFFVHKRYKTASLNYVLPLFTMEMRKRINAQSTFLPSVLLTGLFMSRRVKQKHFFALGFCNCQRLRNQSTIKQAIKLFLHCRA